MSGAGGGESKRKYIKEKDMITPEERAEYPFSGWYFERSDLKKTEAIRLQATKDWINSYVIENGNKVTYNTVKNWVLLHFGSTYWAKYKSEILSYFTEIQKEMLLRYILEKKHTLNKLIETYPENYNQIKTQFIDKFSEEDWNYEKSIKTLDHLRKGATVEDETKKEYLTKLRRIKMMGDRFRSVKLYKKTSISFY